MKIHMFLHRWYGGVKILNICILVFKAHSQNCKKRPFTSLCLSVHMEQLCSHWTDFHEMRYENFQKYVTKIKVSLKSDKNNRYFTWNPTDISDHMLLSSSYNEKCFFRQKL